MTQLTDLLTLMEHEHQACESLRRICNEIEDLNERRDTLEKKANRTELTMDRIMQIDRSLCELHIRKDAAEKILNEARRDLRQYLAELNGDVPCPA